MRVVKRITITIVAALALAGVGTSSQGLNSAEYYGTFAFTGNGANRVILAELDCTTKTAWVEKCDRKTTNKTYRIFDNPLGDLHRVKGKFQDRKDNGKPSYARIDWYTSGQFCVSGDISVGGGSATGGVGASACTGWIGAAKNRSYMNSVKSKTSTEHTHSTSLVSFTGEHVRGAAQNSSRADLRVCENNVLWLSDTCSNTRALTVDFG